MLPGALSPLQILQIDAQGERHRFVFVKIAAPLALLNLTVDQLDLEELSFPYYLQNNWRTVPWETRPVVTRRLPKE